MRTSFFVGNRERLIQKLENELVILSAYSKMQRTNDEAYDFEQESNFWYLTGIEEADWWLILDGKHSKGWLVRPDIDERLVTFNGQLTDEEAKNTSGVDEVISRRDAQPLLKKLQQSHENVYTLKQRKELEKYGFATNPSQKALQKILKSYFNNIRDCTKQLAVQRAIKQPEEIRHIKKAIEITQYAFEYVSKKMDEYSYEYEIEADMSYIMRNYNARHAYSPIVASGQNACTLHYNKNSRKLVKGEGVLIDVGAKIAGYSADITRTYAYGSTSARFKEVHSAVIDAQNQIISLLRPTLSLQDLQHKVDEIMSQKIAKLGLKHAENENSLRRYFPHAIGHGLGVDIHEGLAHTTLQEGMVLTIEPGIYIPEEGIGVRIEDDILITKNGYENLSQNLSKYLVY